MSEAYLLLVKKSLLAFCNCTVGRCSLSTDTVQNLKLFEDNKAGQAGATH